MNYDTAQKSIRAFMKAKGLFPPLDISDDGRQDTYLVTVDNGRRTECVFTWDGGSWSWEVLVPRARDDSFTLNNRYERVYKNEEAVYEEPNYEEETNEDAVYETE
jgi:hypothetical protein